MGGRALKPGLTRRINKEEFIEISQSIENLIKDKVDAYYIVQAFSSKESFGDIDVLICPKQDSNIRNLIGDLFKPDDLYSNGGCHSFNYRECQIDFIVSKPSIFEINKRYLDYNDLGNFIGRISRGVFGLKFGHDGLWFIVRDDKTDQNYDEWLISKDFDRILLFLGFDPDRYKQGFEKLEDIFEFVKSSTFFHPKLFYFESLNHQNRTRNRKRDSYCKFVDFCKSLDLREYPENYKFTKYYMFEYLKGFLNIDLKDKYIETIINKRRRQRVRRKILDYLHELGYQKQELGMRMSHIHKTLDIAECIKDTKEILRTKIDKVLESYKEII